MLEFFENARAGLEATLGQRGDRRLHPQRCHRATHDRGPYFPQVAERICA
jgi:hypothetical protein